MLADDPNHPIPSVANADVIASRTGGGAELVVVIASPLDADERSQQRLLAKFDSYLGFIHSDEFRQEFGAPSADQVLIRVIINPESHPAILDLLERCRPWIEENGASYEINRSY